MNEAPAVGGWSVDERCTNCDVARQLAPGLIGEVRGRSAVLRAPRDDAEVRQLHAAAHACPSRSIHPPDGRLDAALDPFPMALDDTVYLCGHNSRHTAGANSYLLRRPGGTSMMVDTPRWSSALADRYEALGPVTDVLLTHRDHAAHGRRYADRFGARLWIHEGDLDAAPDADRVIRGIEPAPVAEGVTAQPLPGHTRGSVLYLADDAWRAWKAWAHEVEAMMRDGGRLEHLRDWGGKLPGATARVAGLLHLSDHASCATQVTEVPGPTMARAVALPSRRSQSMVRARSIGEANHSSVSIRDGGPASRSAGSCAASSAA